MAFHTRLQFFTYAILLILLFNITPAEAIHTVRVVSGLSLPVFVTAAPGDTTRLFIIEQRSGSTGRIRILRHDSLLTRPFLSVSNLATGTEEGLLGLAFNPDYAINGYFYVHYTRASDLSIVIERFHVSSDPDSADAASGDTLMIVPHPFTNHNGGMLAFGQDGYLYMGFGDGGSGYDPGNRAQSDTCLLGKILRIDVNNGNPYAIPPTNPFVNSPGVRPEIWAKGVRNPWRWSFDRLTHDLYIGDVGQDSTEEIDFQPANSTGGQNYGWRCMEGFRCTGLTGCTCNDPSLTLPVYTYNHTGGRCAILGGYVYRGCAVPSLLGTYFFADLCSNQIWSFQFVNDSVTNFQDRTTELQPGGGLTLGSISSFGEDASGELYICDLYDGNIFKIMPDTDPSPDVQNLTAISSDNDLVLHWTAIASPARYNVYRSSAVDAPFPGAGWSLIATDLPGIQGENATSFTDVGVVPSADRYFYTVTATCP